jgi:hypothetical protein
MKKLVILAGFALLLCVSYTQAQCDCPCYHTHVCNCAEGSNCGCLVSQRPTPYPTCCCGAGVCNCNLKSQCGCLLVSADDKSTPSKPRKPNGEGVYWMGDGYPTHGMWMLPHTAAEGAPDWCWAPTTENWYRMVTIAAVPIDTTPGWSVVAGAGSGGCANGSCSGGGTTRGIFGRRRR